MSAPLRPTRVLGVLLQSLLARRGVLTALAVVAGVGFAVDAARRMAAPSMRGLPQHRVTASTVTLSPPAPPWVRSDVKLEAFRDAGLLGETGDGLSILDPPERLERRVAMAIGFHPWVRSVGRVLKAPPNRLTVEVEYRRPVAVLRFPSGGGRESLVPVDGEAVLLPTTDLTRSESRSFPRIDARPVLQGAGSAPPRAGEPWTDARITGAVALVAELGAAWNTLRLLDIRPSRSPEVRFDKPYFLYELRSTGNTRIAWGAAPGHGPPDEPPFGEKLARLERYVAQNGPLDSVATSPAWIDVRRGLSTRPRVVKKDGETQTAAKPDAEPKTIK